MKHRCELMQLRVAKAFGLDRLHRRGHVIAIGAGLAVALEDMAVLFGQRQPAGILHMAAGDDVSECGGALAGIAGESAALQFCRARASQPKRAAARQLG